MKKMLGVVFLTLVLCTPGQPVSVPRSHARRSR
jgi:hypothetical protein